MARRASLPQRISSFSLPAFLLFSSAIFVQDSLFEITSINGSSMSPALSRDFDARGARDYVLWRKWAPARDLRRGDVVFFAAPHRPDATAVKRIVALPGDTVRLDPRRRPHDADGGRQSDAGRKWDVWGGRVLVPPGHVWVEGDNWRSTQDSNAYGPISQALIQGKAVGLVWPMKEMGKAPWEGYQIRTKVIEAGERKGGAGSLWWEPH